VWSDVKREVLKYLSNNSINAKKVMCEELFAKYTTQKWWNCCEYMKIIKQSYWRSDE
jgi:hypothetical protein